MTKLIQGFTFKPVNKKVTTNKTPKRKKLYQCICIENNNELVAKIINSENKTINDKIFSFSDNSYNIKGKTKLFSKKPDKYNHIVCIIRTKQEANLASGISEIYTPIRKNYIYSGYIVKIENKEYFDIYETFDKSNTCKKYSNGLNTKIETYE